MSCGHVIDMERQIDLLASRNAQCQYAAREGARRSFHGADAPKWLDPVRNPLRHDVACAERLDRRGGISPHTRARDMLNRLLIYRRAQIAVLPVFHPAMRDALRAEDFERGNRDAHAASLMMPA